MTTAPPVKPLDEVLVEAQSDPLAKGLSWREKYTEFHVIEELYGRFEKLGTKDQASVIQAAGILVNAYRADAKSLCLETMDDVKIVLRTLRRLDLMPSRIRYEPSRWVSADTAEKSFRSWRKKTGLFISRGDKTCGRHIKLGRLRLEFSAIHLFNDMVLLDRKLANTLGLFFVTLHRVREES